MQWNQPSRYRPHEICLQERRAERNSETLRLKKLQEHIKMMVDRARLARAS
jgi:hypothetical protein